MKMHIRRPRLTVSGTESTIVFIIALSEGHKCISLKILKIRNALNTETLLLVSGKNDSVMEMSTIIPSNRCRKSVMYSNGPLERILNNISNEKIAVKI